MREFAVLVRILIRILVRVLGFLREVEDCLCLGLHSERHFERLDACFQAIVLAASTLKDAEIVELLSSKEYAMDISSITKDSEKETYIQCVETWLLQGNVVKKLDSEVCRFFLEGYADRLGADEVYS